MTYRSFRGLLAVLPLLSVTACTPGQRPAGSSGASPDRRRLRIGNVIGRSSTPAVNWMNDPNGPPFAAIGPESSPSGELSHRQTYGWMTRSANASSKGSKSRSLWSREWLSMMQKVAMRQSMVLRTVSPRARSWR
jgi:hypothetical protein